MARTYDTRKRSPGTVGELLHLARVLQVAEAELCAVVRAEAARAVGNEATSA